MTTPTLSVATSKFGRLYQRPGQAAPYPATITPKKAADGILRGLLYPSSTNVIGVAAPELGWWYAKMMKDELAETLAAPSGKTLGQLLYSAEKAAPNYTQAACDKGDETHAAVEDYLLTGAIPTEWKHGGEPHFRGFLDFMEDFAPEVVAIERTVYGYAAGLPYAGTLDAILKINGKTFICDWKTSKKMKPSVALQLAAGVYAKKIANDAADGLDDMLEVDGALGIHLAPNAYGVHRVNNLPEAWEAFSALRAAWDWKHFEGAKHVEPLELIVSPTAL